MPDDFLNMLRKRLADARLDQSEARGKTEQLVANAVVGFGQAILHDYERTRPISYDSDRQRKRVFSRVRDFAASPVREIAIKQGEQEARLIAAKLTERGIAATVEQRGDVWIVRKEGSE